MRQYSTLGMKARSLQICDSMLEPDGVNTRRDTSCSSSEQTNNSILGSKLADTYNSIRLCGPNPTERVVIRLPLTKRVSLNERVNGAPSWRAGSLPYYTKFPLAKVSAGEHGKVRAAQPS